MREYRRACSSGVGCRRSAGGGALAPLGDCASRKLADLALRLIAIVAAVGALNLFTLKPKLRVDATCVEAVDLRALRANLAPGGQLPRPLARAVATHLNVVSLDDPGSAAGVGYNSPLDPFVEDLMKPMLPTCRPPSILAVTHALDDLMRSAGRQPAPWRHAPPARRGRAAPEPLTISPYYDVSYDVQGATFPQVRIVVTNGGRASAKNVRVPPPAFLPVCRRGVDQHHACARRTQPPT